MITSRRMTVLAASLALIVLGSPGHAAVTAHPHADAHRADIWLRGLAEGTSAALILLSLGLAGATLRSWSRGRAEPAGET